MNKFICLLLFIGATTLTAQTKPVRIEEKTVITAENSSKYGSQKHIRHDTYIIYDDGTRVKATAKNLKPIAFEMPLGQYEWKKWQQNTHRQLVSFPLLAVGFVGAILFADPETRQQGTLIGGIGLASGLWTVSHFEFQKRKHHRRMIDLCNQHLHGLKSFEESEPRSPDVIKVGVQSSSNGLGFGLKWEF
jgi:hypothetical protein